MKLKRHELVFYMTKHKKKIFILSVLLLSGCVSAPGTNTKDIHYQDRVGVDTLLMPAEYREVYFNDGKTGDKHCRAPGPDFTVQASDGGSVGGSFMPGTKDSLGLSSGESALSLGGRSPEVLLARELFYRACELSLNTNANSQQATDIYYHFLDAVVQLSKHQSKIETVSATDHTNSVAPVVDTQNSSSDNSSNDQSQYDKPKSTININE